VDPSFNGTARIVPAARAAVTEVPTDERSLSVPRGGSGGDPLQAEPVQRFDNQSATGGEGRKSHTARNPDRPGGSVAPFILSLRLPA